MTRKEIERVREQLRALSCQQEEEWSEELNSMTAGFVEGVKDSIEMAECFLEAIKEAEAKDLENPIEGIGYMTNEDQQKPYAKGFRLGRRLGAHVALALIYAAEGKK